MGSNISKRGGRGHGKEKNEDKSTMDENEHGKKKELKDYRYYLGTATQSSEYQKTTDFIVNHIKNEFDNSGDITLALKNLQEYDFSQYRPQLKLSDSSDPTIKRVADSNGRLSAYYITKNTSAESTYTKTNLPRAYGCGDTFSIAHGFGESHHLLKVQQMLEHCSPLTLTWLHDGNNQQ